MTSSAARRLALGMALVIGGELPVSAADGDSLGVTLRSRGFSGNPHAVELAGGLAFVGLDSGLAIHDANAASPAPVGHVYLPSAARDVAVMGSFVLVANDEAGLAVVDASDPTSPVVIASLPTTGTATGVDLFGPIALLAEAGTPSSPVHGLRTIDLTNPATPMELGFAPLLNGPLCVEADGATAYLGLGSDLRSPVQGLVVVDVGMPGLPIEVGFMPTDAPVNDVTLFGAVAACATGLPMLGGLVMADVAVPGPPLEIGRLSLPDAALAVTISAGTAHVAMRGAGLARVDIIDPRVPVLVDRLSTGRSSWGVAHDGSVAWLAERSSAGPASLTSVDATALPGELSVTGTHAFAEVMDVVATPFMAFVLRRDGLHVFDTGDPDTPSPLGAWQPSSADLSHLAIDGDRGVVAQGNELCLLDLSAPSSITEQGCVTLEQGTAVDLELIGNTLFAANGRGLEIFDVTDPASPRFLGSHATASWSAAVAIEGDRAHVVGGDRLEIVDVSSAGSPGLLGTFLAAGSVFGVDVVGDLVALTGPDMAVELVDVSDAVAPVALGSFPGTAGHDVELLGDRAFVASGESGLLILDVTDPTAIALEGFHDTPGRAVAVSVDGSIVHVAASEAQHWILGCDACSVIGCRAQADVQSATDVVCVGEELDLHGSASRVEDCIGTIEYQWFEDGMPIAGAVGDAYVVPSTQAPGTYTFELAASCATEPTCIDAMSVDVTVTPDEAPTLDPESLRVSKAGAEEMLSWIVTAGTGDTNVHRSVDPWELTASALDAATVVAFEPAASHLSTFSPGSGRVAFFRVFGRGACSGESRGN